MCKETSLLKTKSLNIVPVKVVRSNRSIETYAFIDPGSDKTFVDEKFINVLGITDKQVSYGVTSVHKRVLQRKGRRTALDGSGGITRYGHCQGSQ